MPNAPRFDELMWPCLKALSQLGGSASNQELLQKVIEIEGISDEAANVLHTDGRQTRLHYNFGWTKTYLKKVGAIENSSRGVWTITSEGERYSEADCAHIARHVRRMNHERRRSGNNGGNHAAPSNGSQPEGDTETDWKTQLLDIVKAMPPEAFERLAQRLLREAGFIKVEVTQRSGDGGIDGTGVLRVNLISFQVLFQCKRYAGSVGSGVIRDFRGAMAGRCDKGLIITTGTFTADAQKEASRDGATAIDLVDGDFLCDLIKKYGLGVHTRTVEQVVIDGTWFGNI